jgi:hypothetical protein
LRGFFGDDGDTRPLQDFLGDFDDLWMVLCHVILAAE